ncbi:MAG: hypothetical protein Ct9H90mP9_5080 [Pseudomonadota bacterium]|nr:MAG: hypothetical protein Ct9H90mP9_5080 [Pseudomonadota bacterium]
MNPLLKTQNLSKHFGGLQAVEGVNLDLNEGEIRAIIGPNGAGKTTWSAFYPAGSDPVPGVSI